MNTEGEEREGERGRERGREECKGARRKRKVQRGREE